MNVIRQTVEECMVTHFPKQMYLSDVEVDRKSRIEIRVSLAPISEQDRKALFVEVEKQLGSLLRDRFGYTKPFRLVVKI